MSNSDTFVLPTVDKHTHNDTLKFLAYCEKRLPSFKGHQTMIDVILNRENASEEDYALMHTLAKDGYYDVVKMLYENVPNFWPKFSKYCREHEFCWNCVYDKNLHCPKVDGKYKPTKDFVILYKKVIVSNYDEVVHVDNKYFVSSYCKDGKTLRTYAACKFCIGDNGNKFL